MKKLVLLFLLVTLHLSAYSQDAIRDLDTISYINTLQRFTKGNNIQRYRFVKKYAQKAKLNNLKVRTEAIDWFGIYKNVIIEKQGKTDSIVYVVCHYDKIDGNIFNLINSYLNGSLDILFSNIGLSKGAYDNGSGVLTTLKLLDWINTYDNHYTFRFLFTGMEEFGLRGSRTHVSQMKSCEWNRCKYAITIDMIGEQNIDGISITENISDSTLVSLSDSIATKNHLNLIKNRLPKGVLSDYNSFEGQSFGKDLNIAFRASFIGVLIPQRSYFTKKKNSIPTLNFSDNIELNSNQGISYLSPIAFGKIHSYKDNLKVVGIGNIMKYQLFIRELLCNIDDYKKDIK